MENRRIYLPPIQDILNRSTVLVEKNDNSYDQYHQVINGYETDLTSTVNKSTYQPFNTTVDNSMVPDLPTDEKPTGTTTTTIQAAAYYHAHDALPSSNHSELLQIDIPKYRTTPPHSRSYSDHLLHHDQYSRKLSASPSSSSASSVSRSPISQQQVNDYVPSYQQQQQQKANIIHHHPHHHRRTASDITPYSYERNEPTHKQYLNGGHNNKNTSSDEDITVNTQPTSVTASSAANTHYNRYQCSQCSKTFSRPSSLRIHIFSHTGEKPHECPHPGCGRRFSVQSNMRRHLKVHYCGPQSQQDQNYLGKLPLTQEQQQSGGYDVFIAEGGNKSTGKDFYRYSSVSKA